MAKVVKITKRQRLETELGHLFGKNLVALAKQADVTDLNLDSSMLDNLQGAASDLERLSHDPARQRALVKSLGDELAMALCMWLLDNELDIKILRFKLTG